MLGDLVDHNASLKIDQFSNSKLLSIRPDARVSKIHVFSQET